MPALGEGEKLKGEQWRSKTGPRAKSCRASIGRGGKVDGLGIGGAKKKVIPSIGGWNEKKSYEGEAALF